MCNKIKLTTGDLTTGVIYSPRAKQECIAQGLKYFVISNTFIVPIAVGFTLIRYYPLNN
ncbi:hypothetical protein EDC52_107109 [Biostraticola tofi]|uniref:Uncharacterized protein n=1 Tax=Biostraticola tofi TaxID=466109 RepID=A0A4R3YRS5_9GAMM|nr:hypothetical protein EDC52_107109 [Biostraticola tofi]